jgi:hypothetical protein
MLGYLGIIKIQMKLFLTSCILKRCLIESKVIIKIGKNIIIMIQKMKHIGNR